MVDIHACHLLFGLSTAEQPCEYSEYVQSLRECLTYAYGEADIMSRHAKNLQKKYYDKKVQSDVFYPGDRVMVKMCYVEGKHKLADRWESNPYVVVKKQPGIPVYVVCSEDGKKEGVIHRNLLAQCMFFPVGSRHLAGDESDMEKMSGMDSLDAEREEEVVETSVHGESALNIQCTCVESPDVVGEEFEQDKSQSEETVREKRGQSEQTQLKVLNPDCSRLYTKGAHQIDYPCTFMSSKWKVTRKK